MRCSEYFCVLLPARSVCSKVLSLCRLVDDLERLGSIFVLDAGTFGTIQSALETVIPKFFSAFAH